MKISTRGRKPIGGVLKPIILDILSQSQHPLSVNQIAEKIYLYGIERGTFKKRKFSWNTIKKYLLSLEKEGKIYSKKIESSKITYYWSKPIPW